MPTISREPVPDGKQARLNRVTGVLRIDPCVPDTALHLFIRDAICVLAGRSDLAVYARPLTPKSRGHLQVLPGGLSDDSAS